jgi:hypothetical protein
MDDMKPGVEKYEGLDYAVLMNYIEMSKASAHLWFSESIGGSGKGEGYMQLYNTGMSNQRSSQQTDRTTTEDDVLGGALGMVGWALTGGAALGPFGALGGLVAGTVYGAVTGSLFS